jgi:hypothetical protein
LKEESLHVRAGVVSQLASHALDHRFGQRLSRLDRYGDPERSLADQLHGSRSGLDLNPSFMGCHRQESSRASARRSWIGVGVAKRPESSNLEPMVV